MHTFVLLIAIRAFEPGPVYKAIIPAAVSIGLLASPLALSMASRIKLRATRFASVFWMLAAVMLWMASFSQDFQGFLVFIIISLVVYALNPTFMIFAYSSNYTSKQRGQRIGTFFVISSLVSGTFAYYAGQALDLDFSLYPWILRTIAVASFASAIFAYFVPSEQVENRHNASPLKSWSLLWDDRLFGWIILSWMCIGIANLMTIPLRVEYMARDAYGVIATNKEITITLVLIPSICRILSTRIWGYLFDHMNLLALRSILNGLFLISIVLFFVTTDLVVMAIAMGIQGIAHGGGNIAWNLWVTKIATPEKTPAYMSIHTATTGIRGLLSPFLGFFVITQFGPVTAGIAASVLAFVSIVINLPLMRDPRLSS